MTKQIYVNPISDFGQKIVIQNGNEWELLKHNARETKRPFQYLARSKKTGVTRFLNVKDFRFKMPKVEIPELTVDPYTFMKPIVHSVAARVEAGVNKNQFSQYEIGGRYFSEIFIDTSDGEIIVEIPSLISRTPIQAKIYDMFGDVVASLSLPPHLHKIGFYSEGYSLDEWVNHDFQTSNHCLRATFEVPQEDVEGMAGFTVMKIFDQRRFDFKIPTVYDVQAGMNNAHTFFESAGVILDMIENTADMSQKSTIDSLDAVNRKGWKNFNTLSKTVRRVLEESFRNGKKPQPKNYF